MSMAAAPSPKRTRRPSPGLAATIASEWRKFWALASMRLIIAITMGLTVGVTLLIFLFGGGGELAAEQQGEKFGVIFIGGTLGITAFTALAATFVAVEYRSGMISCTLTATPTRWRVLAAKLLIISGLALVVGSATSFLNFAISQSVLGAMGEPTLHLVEDDLLRPVVLFLPLGMLVQSLLTAAVAVGLRNAPAAVVLVFSLNTIPVWIAGYVGDWFANTVPRRVPGATVESIAGVSTPGSGGYLDLVPAVLTLLTWLAAALVAAFSWFSRRDA
ncbi:ABC-type transport system involved in multi-copper enzyme maturation permease subunit [Lipingzhangella halophila]|uniref:ABC-type transport system involved in multi-copper enzyme maturation permease subunit n=1 Tax=Lipingzhangella halophila TaxID=1783352 RepID=A0A7W7W5S6_9ACTN|nr:hypothetical protein [Lipingzhangella halophila]MBB4935532.1 ABC-type transport system involved in multi-copper enzyme maturation permease subunit [Lipingzhangella halophila]